MRSRGAALAPRAAAGRWTSKFRFAAQEPPRDTREMHRRDRLVALLALLAVAAGGCGACGLPSAAPDLGPAAVVLDRLHSKYVAGLAACNGAYEECAVAGRELAAAAETAKAELAALDLPEGSVPDRQQLLAALDQWIAAGEALEGLYWDKTPERAVAAAGIARQAATLEAAAFMRR